MSSHDGSIKVVLTAIVVNSLVTVAKGIGWFISPGPSMLAETIHSFADTSNQLLIYMGIRLSKKGPSREFPSGYGKARYLWNLISASGIFFLGCCFTVYHGISALIYPHHEATVSYGIGISILFFAFIVEGYALYVAYKEVAANQRSRTFIDYLIDNDDPTSIGVLFEDAIAVLGVILALVGMTMSYYFNTHIPDAIASILIGVLLGILSIIMAFMNGRLLINRSMSELEEQEIRDYILGLESVDNITVFKTEVLAPDQVKLSLDINFNSSSIKTEINTKRKSQGLDSIDEDKLQDVICKSVQFVGAAINNMEKQIHNRFPYIKTIDLEIN